MESPGHISQSYLRSLPARIIRLVFLGSLLYKSGGLSRGKACDSVKPHERVWPFDISHSHLSNELMNLIHISLS